MKIATLTFFTNNERTKTQSILGMYEEERTNCPMVNNESCFLYQIRSDDDGKGEPATVEPKVRVNHYADFVTDTKIEFPDENDKYVMIDEEESIDVYYDNEYDQKSYSLMNELELHRRTLLSEHIVNAIDDPYIGNPIVNNVYADEDGNIHLNFYGVPYTLEIHNSKEFE